MHDGLSLPPLALWAGVECTVNRVGERFFDQLARSGFDRRLDDIDRLASLGVQAVRFPLLWERQAPHARQAPDWSWAAPRIERLHARGIRVIAGLVHHGSGPRDTHLLDADFAPRLADYAQAAARRFPMVTDWTPVNEPLTTARFSALYGLWFPHARDPRSFVRALLNQVQGVRLAMATIRAEIPGARLVQTEDLGFVTAASPALEEQARHENERRWLSLDLLCGRIRPGHPLWEWLLVRGLDARELMPLAQAPCPPDIVGINSYVTSERFLDDRLHHYPPALHGGNGEQRYVDIETVRVHATPPGGFAARLREAWDRYRLPLAITEAHLGCTREEQMRWLLQAWQAAQAVRGEGADVRAVTAWAAFGTWDWDNLVTCERGHYEPGLWDARAEPPRETALAGLARRLACGDPPDHPAVTGPGWWQRPQRLEWPVHGPAHHAEDPHRPPGPPLLITGATGTLGQAFARLCEERGLRFHLLARAQMDIADPASVAAALARWQPWAVVNAAGFVRVDDAEADPRHWRENVEGACVLARACAREGVALLGFSSDLVFDGAQARPYVESDAPAPLNAYGRSKHEAERRMLGAGARALVVRTAAFFGPWDPHNFVTGTLAALRRGEAVLAADDQVVSPTYVPDLVHASLDLLVDGEHGLWHLAHPEALTWADLARRAAREAGLDPGRVQGVPAARLGQRARRPPYCALASERGRQMPSLASALARYLRQRALATGAPGPEGPTPAPPGGGHCQPDGPPGVSAAPATMGA